ncbi:hypothetical protein WG907_16575 [Sphingobium sp. AN558]|uniref:hypothetical protein n=1 Tax=Sphingobium sp. AN558 TaxID=3133442 RepID=UPI0030BA7CC7
MKMRRPHRVPLSRQVIAMLKELHEHTHWWKYLFPCFASRVRRCRRTPSTKGCASSATRPTR